MENIYRICPYGEHKIYSRYDIIQFIEKTTKDGKMRRVDEDKICVSIKLREKRSPRERERKKKCKSSLIKARRVKKSSNKLFVREKSIEHMAEQCHEAGIKKEPIKY